ncbi:hypothetical protein ABEF95_006699 [Exophiala dermatitidis]
MSSESLDMQALQTLRSRFSQCLKDFAESSSRFEVLHTIPPSHPPSSQSIRTLYVLDSSFNPPSRAHMSLVKTALRKASSSPTASQSQAQAPQPAEHTSTSAPRVLFLLATVNADKKPKPADFEDRLVMMTLMAEQLRASFNNPSTSNDSTVNTQASTSTTDTNNTSTNPSSPLPIIDIGITKEPYFTDKARCIDESNIYHPPVATPNHNHVENNTSTTSTGQYIEQIHLTGFDTLIRIFTPKYYPNYHPPLSALQPFLSRHRLRATVRVDTDSPSQNLKDVQAEGSGFGQQPQPQSQQSQPQSQQQSPVSADFSTIQGQLSLVSQIADGDFENLGLKREWANRVELVVDESGEAQGVSSTRVREAASQRRWDEVEMLVGHKVAQWIVQRRLYTTSST